MARGGRNRSRFWLLVAAALVAALLIVYDVLRLFERDEQEPDATREPPAGLNAPATDNELITEPAALSDDVGAGAPVSSMVRTLLEGTDANRNQIFRQTITGIGFMCSEVSSSGLIGSSGAIWRVRCTDSMVYSVEIDEFGRMIVAPMPYGDFAPSSEPVRIVPAPERVLPEPTER